MTQIPAEDQSTEIELLDVAPARRNGSPSDTGLDEGETIRRHGTLTMDKNSPLHHLTRYGLPILMTIVVALAVFGIPIIEGRLLTRVVALTVILWGLDVQLGLGGQLSLGHGAFVGAGAYTAAITMGAHGWPFPLAIVAAAVVGLLTGALVGLPSLRIQGQYLAMITLGSAVAFPYVVRRMAWLTGGNDGPRITYEFLPPRWLGLETSHFYRWTHQIVCLIALVMFFCVRWVVKGRLGRQIRAVADNPASAISFGVRVGWVRIYTVALSASVAAVGGALLVFATPAITADSYDPFFSLSLYAAAVFGGIGTLVGSFLGALLLIGAPWTVSRFGWKIEPELIAGVVLVIFTLAARDGVVGLLRPWFRSWFEILEPEEKAKRADTAADVTVAASDDPTD